MSNRAVRHRLLSVRVMIMGAIMIAAVAAFIAGVVGIWQITTVAARGLTIYTDSVVPNQDVGQLREAVGRARMDGLSRANAKTARGARTSTAGTGRRRVGHR